MLITTGAEAEYRDLQPGQSLCASRPGQGAGSGYDQRRRLPRRLDRRRAVAW